MHLSPHILPPHPANRLGVLYRHEAAKLPWSGPIWDVHVHLHSVKAARAFFEVADVFNVGRVWAMANLEDVDALRATFGPRVSFIAIPDYARRDLPETFTTDWLRRIEGFAAKGVHVCKFWAAPRGRDMHPDLTLDSPIRQRGMKLAHELGMIFMVHVGDPDTWFATHYHDHRRYGVKRDHYEPLHRVLEQYPDTPCIAAHMGGDPEHLDHLQALLDRHANLYLDTSATKWMVRELSRQYRAFNQFCAANPGRIFFGSDIVAHESDLSFDLFASRYWALRTLLETDYTGPSPIVDPDLRLVDPSLPEDAAPGLHGVKLDPAVLAEVYQGAAMKILAPG